MSASPGPNTTRTDSHTPRSTPATMLRLLDWARPALPRIALGGATALLASLLALAIPQVLKVVIEGPLLHSSSVSGLVWATALVLVLGLLEAFLVWCRRVFIATAATGAEHDMRVDLYHRLLDLPIGFHNRTSGGQLIQRSMGDLSAVRRWIAFGFVMMVVSVVTIVAGVALMVVNAPPLGLLYLVGAIVMIVLTFRLRRSYGEAARRARDQAGDLATNVEESVQGIRVLKAFGRGEDAHEDFLSQADELRRTELVKAGAQARITAVLTILPESLLAISLGLGAWLVVEGRLTIGGLSAFFVTAAVVNRPVEMLGNLLAMTLDARAALDRYLDVIDLPNPLTDPSDPAPLPEPATAEGSSVELRDVVVQLSPNEPPVLSGLDLTLPPGRTTALVGLTGSGKSTLLALLPRLLDPTAGSVRLDGADVRTISRRDVRTIVAPAFEDSVLFSSTVRDNVLMGADTEDERRLNEALEAAQADFVADLPEGVDTVIGEEGLSLSGGQRQRLSLARAIAAQPRVLVLDDPLSAVDVATETAATDALRRILPGTTTLVVAHRPSTVALADHVVVLENGRITGEGTHAELLAGHPHYRYVLTAMEQEHEEAQQARADAAAAAEQEGVA
ncbi:ABC transporter ATP-binding protein [Salana multivorans]